MSNNTNKDILSQFIDFCKANKTALIAGVLVIAVLGASLGLYLSHKEQARQNAWAQYYNAQIALLTQGEQEGAAAIAALAAQYPDSNAAYYARLMQADLLFTQENYAQAADVYNALLKASNPYVRQTAALSLAAAKQAMKEYAQAITLMQDFIKENPSSFALPQAYFTLALSQELSGDKTAALETYKKLLEDYTKTYFGVFAKDKITQLSK